MLCFVVAQKQRYNVGIETRDKVDLMPPCFFLFCTPLFLLTKFLFLVHNDPAKGRTTMEQKKEKNGMDDGSFESKTITNSKRKEASMGWKKR